MTDTSQPAVEETVAARYGRGPGEDAERLRAKLAAKDQALADRYWSRHNIDDLIQERTAFFDDLIREAWAACIPEKAANDLALFAVGGYGCRMPRRQRGGGHQRSPQLREV